MGEPHSQLDALEKSIHDLLDAKAHNLVSKAN
jgi:hypothetical protein